MNLGIPTIVVAGLFSSIFAKEHPIDFDESRWVPVSYTIGEYLITTKVPGNWIPHALFPSKTRIEVRSPKKYVRERSERDWGTFNIESYGYDYKRNKTYADVKFGLGFSVYVYSGTPTDVAGMIDTIDKRKYSPSSQSVIKQQSYFKRDGREWLTRVTETESRNYATLLFEDVVLELGIGYNDGGENETAEWKQKRVNLFNRVFELIKIIPLG